MYIVLGGKKNVFKTRRKFRSKSLNGHSKQLNVHSKQLNGHSMSLNETFY